MPVAYVVVSFRTDKPVPTFYSIIISPEEDPIHDLKCIQFCARSAEADTYEEAVTMLKRDAFSLPGCAWMAKWLMLTPAEQKKLL